MIRNEKDYVDRDDWILKKRINDMDKNGIFTYCKEVDKFWRKKNRKHELFVWMFITLAILGAIVGIVGLIDGYSNQIEEREFFGTELCNEKGMGEYISSYKIDGDRMSVICVDGNILINKGGKK